MKLKFSLDRLLIFVPVAVALKFVPALYNDLWLFYCSCIAIIPVAGLMGRWGGQHPFWLDMPVPNDSL